MGIESRRAFLVKKSVFIQNIYVGDPNKNADPFPSDDREILSNYDNCCIEVQTDVFRIRK